MSKLFNYIILFLVAVVFTSCEDVVDIELEKGESQLVVDAFLTNDIGHKKIKLRMSNNYLDNTGSPGAMGAEVKITDLLGRTFNFTDPDNNGDYEWIPNPTTDFIPFGLMHNVYTLNVKYEGEEYTSVAYMDSVGPIDSLYYEYVKAEKQGSDTIPEGYILQMKAKDIVGEGTCYWFKTYRNGILYNKPGQINLAYDAAFGPGSDGVQFIPPILFGLSPERYVIGDTLDVELYSIGLPTFFFLNRARTEMTNSGLFATPSANVPTNINNVKKDGKKAVGWFCMASVNRKGVRIK